MSKSDYRIRFEFWLNMDKPEEENIADLIERLKNKRLFSRAIRDGLRLFWDLYQGKTDVLFELFPHLEARLAVQGAKVQEDNTAVLSQLERLETLLLHPPSEQAETDRNNGGLAALAIAPVPVPVFDEEEEDDDLLVVTQASSKGMSATQTFVNSMLQLGESS